MMRLYGYWRSSCTYRVRIALELKGLRVEHLPVHLVQDGGQQHSEAHQGRNPMRQVPVLELEHDDDLVHLSQSVAIMEWLEEEYPDVPLLPVHRIERAFVRQLVEVVNAGIQPLQNLEVILRLRDVHGIDPKPWCADYIRRGLKVFETMIAEEAGDYSFGDRPTLADCALIPQLYNARRFGIDVAQDFPLLAAIDGRCQAQSPFERAHPSAQPDAT